MDGIKRLSKTAYHSALVGKIQSVLAETCTENNGYYTVTGHTRSFVPVEVKSPCAVAPSQLVDVLITSSDDEKCYGETVKSR